MPWPSESEPRRFGPEREPFLHRFLDLLRRGELIRAITWREIRVRYKQTMLGVLWAVAYPLTLMLIFTLVFSRFVGVRSDGHPYPLFSYAALLPWTFFSTATNLATRSFTQNTELVTKIWFPREVLPLASVIASLFDFGIALVLFGILMLFFGALPAWTALYLVPLIAVQLMLTLGVALFTSAINVRYRDIKFVVPLALQVWLYASPVIYSLSTVPEAYRGVYVLNPMVGLVEGYRSALLAGEPPDPVLLAIAALGSALLLAFGWLYFDRVEVHFADVI